MIISGRMIIRQRRIKLDNMASQYGLNNILNEPTHILATHSIDQVRQAIED